MAKHFNRILAVLLMVCLNCLTPDILVAFSSDPRIAWSMHADLFPSQALALHFVSIVGAENHVRIRVDDALARVSKKMGRDAFVIDQKKKLRHALKIFATLHAEKIMVVGDAMPMLPIVLSEMGVQVAHIDLDPDGVDQMNRRLDRFGFAGSQSFLSNLDAVHAVEDRLFAPNSFDLISLFSIYDPFAPFDGNLEKALENACLYVKSGGILYLQGTLDEVIHSVGQKLGLTITRLGVETMALICTRYDDVEADMFHLDPGELGNYAYRIEKPAPQEPRLRGPRALQPEVRKALVLQEDSPMETVELSGHVMVKIARLVDAVVIIVGYLFGLPIDMIQQVRDKIKVRVFLSSAPSSFFSGEIHISLLGSVNSREKIWRLLRSIASEVGHAYHYFLVETRPGSNPNMAEGVKEVFDAAAKIGLVAAVDFDALHGIWRSLDAGYGEDILAALKSLKTRPEHFSGESIKVNRRVLRKIAVAMKSKHDIKFIARRLHDIASDFFMVLPGDSDPLPYGAHHLIAGAILRGLLRKTCDSNSWWTVRVVGQTLLGNPFHFTSVGRFSSRLKHFAPSVPKPIPRETDNLAPAVSCIRQAIQSIEERPLGVPVTALRSSDEFIGQRAAKLTKDLVGQVLAELMGWGPDVEVLPSFGSIPFGLRHLKSAA